MKVAVRVRPFSAAERADGCRAIVHMQNQSTYLVDPAGLGASDEDLYTREFCYDYSYWSFDKVGSGCFFFCFFFVHSATVNDRASHSLLCPLWAQPQWSMHHACSVVHAATPATYVARLTRTFSYVGECVRVRACVRCCT